MAAADLFEGLAQIKRLHKRSFPDDRRDEERRPGQRDFLFDLLKLNVDYVTRLSELSREHHALASRSLERLYNIAAPRIVGPHRPELSFGGPDGVWTRSFTVENRIGPELSSITIKCSPFQGPRPSAPFVVLPEVTVDGSSVLLTQPIRVRYGTLHTLRVTFFPADFGGRSGGLFSAEISVELTDRVRRIPITVDVRKG